MLKRRAKRSERSGTWDRLSSKRAHESSKNGSGMMFKKDMQRYSPTLGGTRFLMFFFIDDRNQRRARCCALPITFFSTSFMDSWISSCNIDSIPRSAAAAEGRDPRSTATEGSDRPKAAIDGGRRPVSGRVEPAEHKPVQRRQFIQVRKGPFDPPLCISPRVCPSDAMLLPNSTIRHAMALLRPAQVPCRLNEKQ